MFYSHKETGFELSPIGLYLDFLVLTIAPLDQRSFVPKSEAAFLDLPVSPLRRTSERGVPLHQSLA